MHGSPSSRAGYLIAGGKSTRMGENKAFIDFRGQSLLERALQTLRQACDAVTIVGDPETFGHYAHVISDIFPGCGPLAGIHAALNHSSADLNVVMAVDMPFVSPRLLKFLLNQAAAATVAVTVPRTSHGLQPLCAVYRRCFASLAEQAIRAGNYKIDATFAESPISVVTEQQLAAAGFPEQDFFNINTPEDRLAAHTLR